MNNRIKLTSLTSIPFKPNQSIIVLCFSHQTINKCAMFIQGITLKVEFNLSSNIFIMDISVL